MADIYLVIIIVIVATIILSIYAVTKKYFLMEISWENAEELKYEAKEIFNKRGYIVKEKKGNLYVEHTIFVACRLTFEQRDSDVIIYRYAALTTTAEILMILGFFVTGALLSLGILFSAILNSKKFAKEVIFTLIKGHRNLRCMYCNKKIPYDSKICPYCGKNI